MSSSHFELQPAMTSEVTTVNKERREIRTANAADPIAVP
jgi:hypothetical protein